jgi:hypothetical protein
MDDTDFEKIFITEDTERYREKADWWYSITPCFCFKNSAHGCCPRPNALLTNVILKGVSELALLSASE